MTGKAKISGLPLGVVFMDLDQFKVINDEFGHHTGDAVLPKLTKRFHGAIREQDRRCRWGGDDFVLLLFGIRKEKCADLI